MKNIQVIDGADNAVYDIFSATDDEFALIFPPGQDIAFIDEVFERTARSQKGALNAVFEAIWKRRIAKYDAIGIHGLLFYELDHNSRVGSSRTLFARLGLPLMVLNPRFGELIEFV